jgi:hypothetical protein
MQGATQRLVVLRHAAGERDAEGVPQASFVVSETLHGNLFETTSRELIGSTWTQIQEWKALLPGEVALSERDALIDDSGTQFRVRTVAHRRGPTGAVHHTSVILVRVES